MHEVAVQVVQAHGVQSIGLVTHPDSDVTMILHFGGGSWRPVAGIRGGTDEVASVAADFALNADIQSRLSEMQAAIHGVDNGYGVGVALSSTTGRTVVTG